MKKVSIVVPVYKSEAFLSKLIDSVLGQSYTNFELILVDDESPDNSGKICDDYAQKDKRILVIHKKNGGCCDARNKGLEVATGEYLMLADGDDWLESDCVEYLVGLMEKNDCEMATTDSVFTTRNRIQNEIDNIRICSKEQAMADILYVNIPLGPWNKIYTTSVIRKHHLCFDIPWFGEGLYFSVMAAQFSNKVAIGHRKIYNYRLNNPNSGLTKHEVQHGINALWNIKNIERKLEVRTPMTIHAVNWHHCFNCNFLMQYIIWAGMPSEYKQLYKDTKKEFRKIAFSSIVHACVPFRRKAYVMAAYFWPVWVAKFMAKRAERKFKADIMK